jgi:ABC-type Fe3+-hydroxamate transport system substrate-binding protein
MKLSRNSAARTATVLLAIGAALMLSGCAGTSNGAPVVAQSESPTVSTEPTAATPTAEVPEVLSLEQLHRQYLASGLPCTWVVTDNVMLGSVASGRCTDTENGISTFPAPAEVTALLKLNADSIEPGIFLVGDQWVVASEHPQDLLAAQAAMGGKLWPTDSAVFSGK